MGKTRKRHHLQHFPGVRFFAVGHAQLGVQPFLLAHKVPSTLHRQGACGAGVSFVGQTVRPTRREAHSAIRAGDRPAEVALLDVLLVVHSVHEPNRSEVLAMPQLSEGRASDKGDKRDDEPDHCKSGQ